ncbi:MULTISPECIES: distal tail protein Dit [Bacillus cereus group]|uniref:distal tail protein Dit n=1 Tax=Bacillus cereus group TaxID=86661 RepID=UPI000C28656A|nr:MULTISPECIES: distal tail protein Dit [Bacillus cereus group]HDR4683564.1 phage tail family protein [Bacillus cereus]HDR4687017.1 phage tail family protein [Bacillus cereus]
MTCDLSFFSFNGKRMSNVVPLQGVKRPGWARLERKYLEVPHYPGGRLLSTQTKMRRIEIPVALLYETAEEGEKLKEEIADWLITDQPAELIFDDEKDRTFLAVIDEGFDLEQLVNLGEGVLHFVCPMPYKLGAKQVQELKAWDGVSSATFENKGSVDTPALIEFTASQPSTYIDVWHGNIYDKNNQDYFRLGYPMSIETEAVPAQEVKLKDPMNNTALWTRVLEHDNMDGSSTMRADKNGFHINEWGPPNTIGKFRSAIMKRSIPGGPLTNFRFEATVSLASTSFEMGRVSIILLDEAGKEVAHMNINDLYWTTELTKAHMRIGERYDQGNTYKIMDSDGKPNVNLNNFKGKIAMARRGHTWSAYVAKFRPGTDIEDGKLVEWFFDDDINPMTVTGTKVAQVMIAISGWQNNEPCEVMSIHEVVIWKENNVLVNQTPYLIEKGDKVVIDTERSLVTINGLDAIASKDVFSEFPVIKRGTNKITVLPATLDAKVIYKERYR